MLMAAKTGHLGPTVFRSKISGRRGRRRRPPAFAKAPEGEKGRVVDHVFWLTPGHASEPGVWYAGTSPQGLFRSEDGGDTWESVTGFNDHPMREKWTGGPGDGTPDGPKMHSINIDPRDPNRIYIGMSSGGVFESTDRGPIGSRSTPGARPIFSPTRTPNTAMTRIACGCIRSNRTSSISRTIAAFTGWIVAWRAESRAGFASARRCRNRSATSAFRWSCTRAIPTPSGSFRWTGLRFGRALLPESKPAAYVTHNGGKTWKRLDEGLPSEQAWFTVFRQAMTADTRSGRNLFRHDLRRGLGERQRRREMELHRQTPAADLRGRSR